MRLHAESPTRIFETIRECQFHISRLFGTVHRLDKEVLKIKSLKICGVQNLLWKYELEFVTRMNCEFGTCFGTAAEPVDTAWWLQCSIRFNGHFKALLMKCVDGVLVELQEGFTAGANHEWALIIGLTDRPATCDCLRKLKRGTKVTSAGAIDSDEIRVAETANGGVAIDLATGPQIATAETAKHGRASGLDTFTLKRVDDFFDRVGHSAILCLTVHDGISLSDFCKPTQAKLARIALSA